MSQIKRIAITSGEPAGIGPELIVKIAQQQHSEQLVIIGDSHLLSDTAKFLNLPLTLIPFNDRVRKNCGKGEVFIQETPLAEPAYAGKLSTKNANYVLRTLDIACQGCLENVFDAMVTPPVHKGIINQAGIPFSGHTEYLQQYTDTAEVVMMLASDKMRVALATTHIPLSEVSQSLSASKLSAILKVLVTDLKNKFNIEKPRILICGLNPHAGEDGHMGLEEIETITPTLASFTDHNPELTAELIGPLPADTLFNEKLLKDSDAVLAMYHDQGLPVLKYASFGKAVNITLGLPIIRTSVDHGTAIDIAGTNQADTGSLMVAIKYAISLAYSQSKHAKG